MITAYQRIYPTSLIIPGSSPPSHHVIFIPLHLSSQGTCSHCITYLRSLSHCIVTTYQGISILHHIIGSQSHCIAYRDLYPTSLIIPGSPSIASLHSSNPTNTSSLSMIHLGLPRPLQVFLSF